MTSVYRIQDANGRGPFKPGMTRFWSVDRPDHDNLRPWLESVSHSQLATWHRKYRHLGCGCLTLEELRRWFVPREYETLLLMGYRAVEIGADSILWRDGTQVVFGRRRPLALFALPVALYEASVA